ncbi:MAG: hypothetical protein ACW97V_18145 [Promethearchaeota archaeon]|jgi:hypothetical protein
MAEEKQSQFYKNLLRDNDVIKEDRAVGIAEAANDAQNKLVIEKRQHVRNLNSKLRAMTDLSASNVSTDVNRIHEFDAEKFVNKYHNMLVELEIAQRELTIAQKTLKEIF